MTKSSIPVSSSNGQDSFYNGRIIIYHEAPSSSKRYWFTDTAYVNQHDGTYKCMISAPDLLLNIPPDLVPKRHHFYHLGEIYEYIRSVETFYNPDSYKNKMKTAIGSL